MTYVYILQCIAEPDRFYTGFTDDLKARLKAHSSGQVPHTAKFQAVAFEYLSLIQ